MATSTYVPHLTGLKPRYIELRYSLQHSLPRFPSPGVAALQRKPGGHISALNVVVLEVASTHLSGEHSIVASYNVSAYWKNHFRPDSKMGAGEGPGGHRTPPAFSRGG